MPSIAIVMWPFLLWPLFCQDPYLPSNWQTKDHMVVMISRQFTTCTSHSLPSKLRVCRVIHITETSRTWRKTLHPLAHTCAFSKLRCSNSEPHMPVSTCINPLPPWRIWVQAWMGSTLGLWGRDGMRLLQCVDVMALHVRLCWGREWEVIDELWWWRLVMICCKGINHEF